MKCSDPVMEEAGVESLKEHFKEITITSIVDCQTETMFCYKTRSRQFELSQSSPGSSSVMLDEDSGVFHDSEIAQESKTDSDHESANSRPTSDGALDNIDSLQTEGGKKASLPPQPQVSPPLRIHSPLKSPSCGSTLSESDSDADEGAYVGSSYGADYDSDEDSVSFDMIPEEENDTEGPQSQASSSPRVCSPLSSLSCEASESDAEEDSSDEGVGSPYGADYDSDEDSVCFDMNAEEENDTKIASLPPQPQASPPLRLRSPLNSPSCLATESETDSDGDAEGAFVESSYGADNDLKDDSVCFDLNVEEESNYEDGIIASLLPQAQPWPQIFSICLNPPCHVLKKKDDLFVFIQLHAEQKFDGPQQGASNALEKKGEKCLKTLRFARVTEVLPFYDDEDYRSARHGLWEEMARDRFRFNDRIKSAAEVLNPILSPQHRQQVLESLIA